MQVTLVSITDRSAYEALSDDDGRFTISDITPGRYTLVAERQGYLRKTFGARRSFQKSSVIEFSAAKPVPDVALELSPQATISGRTLDETGEPLSNVQLTLFRKTFSQGAKRLVGLSLVTSNDLGAFRFAGLEVGTYYLQAVYHQRKLGNSQRKGATEDYMPAFFPGVESESAAEPIKLTAGESIDSVTLSMRKTRTVAMRGEAQNADGTVNTGTLRFLLIRAENGQTARVNLNMDAISVVNRKGQFEATNIAPGSYSLIAVESSQSQRLVGQTFVNVGNVDLENVRLFVSVPPSVNGRVIISDTQRTTSLQNIRITLSPINNVALGPTSTKVGPDGLFMFDYVSRDKYRVTVSGLSEGLFLSGVRVAGQETTTTVVDLTSSAKGPLEVTLAGTTAQIVGSVGGELVTTASPLEGVVVVLVPDQEDLRPDTYQAALDQNGKFVFTSIPPGTYRVYAIEETEPGSYLDPEVLQRYSKSSVTVKVAKAGTETVSLMLAQ